ncbi:Ger(x)C family spore germination protein [Bacillus sp. OTU530]|uniref:Ger(x)C family spore germination protein n=1 Tax=Bacillus sp. OTU530 TaxID=3043862 RepID=UPI00406C8C4B
MKTIRNLLAILGCFMLIGCWDQHLMKEATLVQTVSFDLTREGKFLLGTVIPILTQSQSESGQGFTKSETLSATAHTPREGRAKIDRRVSGVLDASNNKLILFGGSFVRQGIVPSLDVIYRDPRSSLSAKLAVVDGEAVKLLRLLLLASLCFGPANLQLFLLC